MKTSADEVSPDRLRARAFSNSLVSAAFIIPASLIFRSSLPLMVQILGVQLWAVASAFLLRGILFSLTAYKESKRLPLHTVVALALPVLAAGSVAFL